MTLFDSPAFWLNLTRVIIFLLTLVLAWLTYQSNLLLQEYQPDFNVLLAPPELLMRGVLVGLCLFLAWLSGLSRPQLGLISPFPFYSLGVGVGLGVAIQISLNIFTQGAIRYFGPQIYSPLVMHSILPRHLREWPLVGLAMLPAVAMEELLFRTLWLGVFGSAMPLFWLIIATSILFGFMHQPQGNLGIILTGSVNVLFCLLFVWSGELLIPFVAHYTINMLQLALADYHRDWLENYSSPPD
jgi:membrane protease YdiL (CAAX protease family)